MDCSTCVPSSFVSASNVTEAEKVTAYPRFSCSQGSGCDGVLTQWVQLQENLYWGLSMVERYVKTMRHPFCWCRSERRFYSGYNIFCWQLLIPNHGWGVWPQTQSQDLDSAASILWQMLPVPWVARCAKLFEVIPGGPSSSLPFQIFQQFFKYLLISD